MNNHVNENTTRTFIDDWTGKTFKYSLAQVYDDGSYHCNICVDGSMDDAYSCAAAVQQAKEIKIRTVSRY